MNAKRLFTASAAIAAISLAVPASAEETPEQTKGEIKLAKMLEGRVAGEPTSCIRNYRNARLTVIDKTALVYKVGRTLYVNIPKEPDDIDSRDTLVRRSSTNDLCKTDIVTTVDYPGGFYTGNVFLGDFIPYRKEG